MGRSLFSKRPINSTIYFANIAVLQDSNSVCTSAPSQILEHALFIGSQKLSISGMDGIG